MFQGAHGAEMNLGQEPANQPVNITAVVTNQKSMLITCEKKIHSPKPPITTTTTTNVALQLLQGATAKCLNL